MTMRDQIMKMIDDYIFKIEHQEMISSEHIGLATRDVVWELRQINDRIFKTFPVEGLEMLPHKELEIFQSQVGRWAEGNFGKTPAYRPLLGAVEEMGELAHAQLKKEQGVREGEERFEIDASDAIGDILVYLAHYCAVTGLSLQEAVDTTWAKVRQRDWKKYPKTGMPPKKIQGELLPVEFKATGRGDEKK